LLSQLDLNGDGVVDAADFNILIGNFGQDTDIGDFDGDGTISADDLNLWTELLNQYGGYDDPVEEEEEEEAEEEETEEESEEETDPNQDVFDQMDADGDGTVTQDEWRDYRQVMRDIRDGELEYDEAYDLNGDGVVDDADIQIANQIRNGGTPLFMEEEGKQDKEEKKPHEEEVEKLVKLALDESKPGFTVEVAVLLAGALSRAVGVEHGLPQRVREGVNRGIDADKKPAKAPAALTGDAGGGGLVGGTGTGG
jgi:Ca2+-binding EF-hand superfamily protein